MKKLFSRFLVLLTVSACVISNSFSVSAATEITSPSAIVMEASTGQVIYEKNATERRSPASITKIMTLLLTFEALSEGKISLSDSVITSDYAAGMGGSQVYLESGEVQTVETLIKCVTVASANDACVALGEFIAGSEGAFVDQMNQKAVSLGMVDTHFEDCCGLSDSDMHYTSAKDVAIMSRELITLYPEVFEYTGIWMEDITHVTNRGESVFTLSSTNKLLKSYPYTTGLKTGSTSKAKFCVSATASKDDMEMIAVVMGCENSADRFTEAAALLNYGFSVSSLYVDENQEALDSLALTGAIQKEADIAYSGEFRYLDTENRDLTQIVKSFELPQNAQAPVEEGQTAGYAVYSLNGQEIGRVEIVYTESIATASLRDYYQYAFSGFLLSFANAAGRQ
ncbi:MAG: D-alanyl-D-alanine carboxypeptidase [Lachnospiraceae bacterium]|nr:D-alanyl-D-alanine carboxypeptidase [Lachnospiraceae bacterium]